MSIQTKCWPFLVLQNLSKIVNSRLQFGPSVQSFSGSWLSFSEKLLAFYTMIDLLNPCMAKLAWDLIKIQQNAFYDHHDTFLVARKYGGYGVFQIYNLNLELRVRNSSQNNVAREYVGYGVFQAFKIGIRIDSAECILWPPWQVSCR